jgi:hypothetical protein
VAPHHHETSRLQAKHYRLVLKGAFEFHSPWWDNISDDAKVRDSRSLHSCHEVPSQRVEVKGGGGGWFRNDGGKRCRRHATPGGARYIAATPVRPWLSGPPVWSERAGSDQGTASWGPRPEADSRAGSSGEGGS